MFSVDSKKEIIKMTTLNMFFYALLVASTLCLVGADLACRYSADSDQTSGSSGGTITCDSETFYCAGSDGTGQGTFSCESDVTEGMYICSTVASCNGVLCRSKCGFSTLTCTLSGISYDCADYPISDDCPCANPSAPTPSAPTPTATTTTTGTYTSTSTSTSTSGASSLRASCVAVLIASSVMAVFRV